MAARAVLGFATQRSDDEGISNARCLGPLRRVYERRLQLTRGIDAPALRRERGVVHNCTL